MTDGARKLHAKRDDLAQLLTEDVLTEAGVRQEHKRIDARLAQISTCTSGRCKRCARSSLPPCSGRTVTVFAELYRR